MSTPAPTGATTPKPKEPTRLDGALQDIVLSLLTLTLPMFALTAIFIGLVYAYQVDTPADNSASSYYVNYSSTRLVTVSSWTSTATSLILPFAATLLAYPVARSLMQNSAANDVQRLPTPYQLNLMVGLLSGGPGPLWNYVQYLCWSKRPRIPRMVATTAAGISLFFILGLGILAADTWLHVTTTTVPYGIVNANQTPNTQFGRGMSAECFPPVDNNTLYGPCLGSNSLYGQSSRFLRNSAEAYRTLANLSSINSVRTSSIDGKPIAHIIDQHSGYNLDYRATTTGIQTECTPITTRCNLAQGSYCPREFCVGQSGLTQYFNYSCPGPLTGRLDTSQGIAFENGSSVDLQSFTNFFIQFYNDTDLREIRWPENSPSRQFYPNPLHFITGSLIPPSDQLSADPEAPSFSTTDSVGIILGCHTTIMDLTFDFRNGTVSGGMAQRSNDTLSTGLGWAMSDYRGRSNFQSHLDGAVTGAAIASSSAQDMADRFAQSYSEISMGLMAGIMTPRATLEEQQRQNVLVTRMPKAPFFTLLVLNLLYAGLGVALGTWALSGQPRVARDAQARLTVAGLVSNLLEPDGIPRRGQGIEGLFTDKQTSRPVGTDKRVAIEKVDDRRWLFRVLPLVAPTTAIGKPLEAPASIPASVKPASTSHTNGGQSSPVSTTSGRTHDDSVSPSPSIHDDPAHLNQAAQTVRQAPTRASASAD